MKKITMLFIGLLFISSCGESTAQKEAMKKEMNTSVNATTATIVNLSAAEFESQLKGTSEAVLLDVRTPSETEKGTMEGVEIIDFHGAGFEAKIDKLDKNKPYYVYCAGGVRSAKVCEMMKKKGFTKLYNLEGGYGGWQQWKVSK